MRWAQLYDTLISHQCLYLSLALHWSQKDGWADGWQASTTFWENAPFPPSPTPCNEGHYSFLGILLSSACRRENLETTPPAGKVSHDPLPPYTVSSSLLYHSRVFFARFFHLGRFFLSFSQLFSSVTAPSYHPALTWSPRLRNILSSVVLLAYYFISDTFTLNKSRRKKWKNFVFSTCFMYFPSFFFVFQVTYFRVS